MTGMQHFTGILASVADTHRIITCTSQDGKRLSVRYRDEDGVIHELPPCTIFEILNIDVDGASIVPDMLDAAPPISSLDRVKSTLKAALDAAQTWDAERTTARQSALESYGWGSPQHDATFDGALKSGTLADLLTRASDMFSKGAE